MWSFKAVLDTLKDLKGKASTALAAETPRTRYVAIGFVVAVLLLVAYLF